MDCIDALLRFLRLEGPKPALYGWVHFLFLALVAAVTVFLCFKFRDCPDRVFRRILFAGWILIVVLEIYKQAAFIGFQGEPGNYHWDYQWYAFPFQFCSAPLYVLPFIIFCKPGKVRDACMAFMTTFSLFAGLSVCAYPGDVFSVFVGINAQTMAHHGLQVVFGIFIAVYNRRRVGFRWYLSALPVFGVLAGIAMLLNWLVPLWFSREQTFNMFFISWRFPSTLPIMSAMYQDVHHPNVPYPVALLIYFAGFLLAAWIVFAVLFALIRRTEKRAREPQAAEKGVNG